MGYRPPIPPPPPPKGLKASSLESELGMQEPKPYPKTMILREGNVYYNGVDAGRGPVRHIGWAEHLRILGVPPIRPHGHFLKICLPKLIARISNIFWVNEWAMRILGKIGPGLVCVPGETRKEKRDWSTYKPGEWRNES